MARLLSFWRILKIRSEALLRQMRIFVLDSGGYPLGTIVSIVSGHHPPFALILVRFSLILETR